MSELATRIKNVVSEEFTRQKINLSNLLAILFVLGQAKSEQELVALVRLFADAFEPLKVILDEMQSKEKSGLEQNIQEVVKKMVMDNPIRAAEIAKEALQPGATLEGLTQKYPEIIQYK